MIPGKDQRTRARWKNYWAIQRLPLHREDSDAFYRMHGAELATVIGETTAARVLELGCGNGALFNRLRFDRAHRYVGVDYSASMLAGFGEAGPNVELICADITRIKLAERFDLVFSNALVQYIGKQDFDDHLEVVAALLEKGGRYVCAGVPAAEHWCAYASGKASLPVKFRPIAAAKEAAGRLVGRSALGTWYSARELDRAARRAGLSLSLYGSMCYLYRYHAVFESV
jgi:cyclopropane fatty-acyl-phospholipid synthase-like methyltransferase